ncbi:hypothetical protein PYW07_006990 [Mythimna separata]|uniref:Seroin transcript 1B n=1 Tax=Mythimna separata TaxID=271217 RepID=A0AAD8E091_MYTSE|nr:hypothetical protein PYW07_006990 [Mythimna separata]
MGFTTLLVTVSMVTIANAGFPGWPNNEYSGYPSPMMPSLRFGSMSGMPTFQNPFFQFPAFPSMPTITFPSMPSPADLANVKPGKGGSFTGVMISAKTESKRKEDGSIVKESGSTILMNNDGVVTVKKTGNAPDLETSAPTTKVRSEDE